MATICTYLLEQLEQCAAEQAAAIRTISSCRQHFSTSGTEAEHTASDLPPAVLELVCKARDQIVANAARMQTLLETPAALLQRLTKNIHVLAGLQWLCEFQVLACIPLDDMVPIADVAFFSSVPEAQLRRIVKLMATARFLQEPKPDYVAHTIVSAPFVAQPELYGAAHFLSNTIAPAALSMSQATKRFKGSQLPGESAYNIAFEGAGSFEDLCRSRPRLQEQWPAYLRHGSGDTNSGVEETLKLLDWRSLSGGTVVDVGARTVAAITTFTKSFPSLRIVIQSYEDDRSLNDIIKTSTNGVTMNKSHVEVQHRPIGTWQTVTDAALYLLHLSSPTPMLSTRHVFAEIAAELSAHVDVLRSNPASRLVLVARVLPRSGTVDAETESFARLRDVSLLQLVNGREIDADEVLNILRAVQDEAGGLALVREIASQTSPVVAFEIQYRSTAAQLHGSR